MIILQLYNKRILSFLVALLLLVTTQSVYAQSAPLPEEKRIEFDTRFINGNKFLMLKMVDEALKEFKQALYINPKEGATNYLVSQIYLQKGLLADAEQHGLIALQSDPKNTWYTRHLAEVYRQQKQYTKAAKLYQGLYSLSPTSLNYLYDATYLYVMAHELKPALNLLNEADQKIGINPDIIKQKESIYLAQGKGKKAVAEGEKLVRAFPNNTEYMGQLADLYLKVGKEAEANKLLNQILTIEPDNGFALLSMAEFYRNNKQYDLWLSNTLAAIRSNKLDVKPKLRVIVESITRHDFGPNQRSKTIELAIALTETHPGESSAWMLLGDLYAQQKKLEEAHRYYEKAVQADPSNYRIWQQLITCSSELNNHEWIMHDCERAIELFPTEGAFYAYYTFSATQLKQYQKAIDMAKRGIAQADGEVSLQAQLYVTIGDAAHYLKQYEKSDSAFEEAISIDPNNGYAMNNYAYFLSLRKTKLVKAAEYSKRSLDLDPKNASFFDTYGWILFVQKDYVNARKNIEQSLLLEPTNAEVMDHYGDVLFHLGETDKAVENWQKAKSLGYTSPVLDEKIKDKKWYEQ